MFPEHKNHVMFFQKDQSDVTKYGSKTINTFPWLTCFLVDPLADCKHFNQVKATSPTHADLYLLSVTPVTEQNGHKI